MPLRPHSREWYDRLAQLQQGYYFPWRSEVAPGNGEDAYVRLVRQHLSPDTDLLDVGCGHGEFTLTLAAECRSILAYDRVLPYVRIGRRMAREAGVRNVHFVCADSSAEGTGSPTIPAQPDSFALIISRRGPLHYIEDVRRVARVGATIIQLNPMETVALPWHEELPPALRIEEAPYSSIRESVERRLSLVGLRIHSCWIYDVPEVLPDPEQLYVMLSWGRAPEETPPYAEVREVLDGVFARHASEGGLVLRHRRFLWMATVD
jgi:23S rRNA (guanine745-N1)-methyltransferase